MAARAAVGIAEGVGGAVVGKALMGFLGGQPATTRRRCALSGPKRRQIHGRATARPSRTSDAKQLPLEPFAADTNKFARLLRGVI